LKKAPFVVAFLRIILAPVFFFAFMWDFVEVAISLYALGFISDIVDGFLARRLEATSSSLLEAYMDPIADFTLVLTCFSAFSLRSIYPSWILIVFVIMFLFFILSSRKKKPVYDPVGKYYGTFLIVMIGVTLLFPLNLVYNINLLSIIMYTIVLAVYRTTFLFTSQVGIE